jgi:hypothetical protein
MRKSLVAVTAALMIGSTVSGAFARAAVERCAKPDDITAMQAAAVQQQLMVASLSCQDYDVGVPNYNSFVIAYQPELFAADKALLRFFKRMNARTGEADYHSFKTHLANMSSQLSIHDLRTYCNNAKAAYALALGPSRSTLAAFVATQPIVESSTYATCTFAVAGGIAPHAPKMIPIPIMKPGDDQLPPIVPAVANVVTAPVRAVTGIVSGILSHLPPFNANNTNSGATH